VHDWFGYIDWLLLVTIYVSLLRDPGQALFTGTAAGLLQDAASYSAIGISGMADVLAAYLAYWVSSRVYVEGLFIRILTVIGGSLVSTLTRLALCRILGFNFPPLAGARSAMMWIALSMAANLLISLPFFTTLDRLFKPGLRQRARRAEAMRGMRRRRWKKMV
jgi:rod shape-determining protein MreD